MKTWLWIDWLAWIKVTRPLRFKTLSFSMAGLLSTRFFSFNGTLVDGESYFLLEEDQLSSDGDRNWGCLTFIYAKFD